MDFFTDADIAWPILGFMLVVYLFTYPTRWIPLFETIYGYSRNRAYITGVVLLTAITAVGLLILGGIWYLFTVSVPNSVGQVCAGGSIILLWTYSIYSLDRRWRDQAYAMYSDDAAE
jgi:hypothetical protein